MGNHIKCMETPFLFPSHASLIDINKTLGSWYFTSVVKSDTDVAVRTHTAIFLFEREGLLPPRTWNLNQIPEAHVISKHDSEGVSILGSDINRTFCQSAPVQPGAQTDRQTDGEKKTGEDLEGHL